MIKNKTILLILLLLSFSTLLAQGKKKGVSEGKKINPDEADDLFQAGNYLGAKDAYFEILKYEPNNVEFNVKLARCYLNTNVNRKEALKYLQVATKSENCPPEVWVDLAKAYQLNNQFESAKKTYETYLNLTGGKAEDAALVQKEIENCLNAPEMMKNPKQVFFKNLGDAINTKFPDYLPWINRDETQLIFTSRRAGNMGASAGPEYDGFYSSDVYTTKALNGEWEKAKREGQNVNTELDEQCVGFKSDGTEMILYVDHVKEVANLWSSQKKGDSFKKSERMADNINKFLEFSGSISSDGTKFFLVRKAEKDNYGESDIYMCKRSKDGLLSEPQNLGPIINTPFKEDSPYLSEDGKTLYFASQGHKGMGGFDLFKSEYDEESNTWSKPVNLGYPINTSDDERQICFLPDESIAYIAANRDGGMGDLDIYRITFEAEVQPVSIVRGKISSEDTLSKQNVDAILNVKNIKTNEQFTFKPNPRTGKYIMALKEGEYELKLISNGFKEIKEKFRIGDVGGNRPEFEKNYILKK
jgi:tetratricopeptide (TPR) repeat protein